MVFCLISLILLRIANAFHTANVGVGIGYCALTDLCFDLSVGAFCCDVVIQSGMMLIFQGRC